MQLASIDIGTNSTRLLVSECKKGVCLTLERKMEITRIGKDLNKTGDISKSSAKRTLEALSRYKRIMEVNNVEKYRAVGTNALRKAGNSQWFKNLALKKTGIRIEIISSLGEASLSFKGAIREPNIDKTLKLIHKQTYTGRENILIIDIGGGSTEFILGSKEEDVKIIESIETGCVTLTEKYGENLDEMKDDISKSISSVLVRVKKEKFAAMIGLAGTITTLAAIDLKLEKYDREKIHHYILKISKVRELLISLSDKGIQERKEVTGLDPKRADIIVAGALILSTVMEHLEIKNVVVSENDILDGIIYSMIDF